VADFRQFYAIDLPLEDTDDITDAKRCAMLWQALPRQSRTMKRLQPENLWDDATYLLHSIEYTVRVLAWMQTKAGQKGRNAPKPIQTPAERVKNQRRADAALKHKQEISDALGVSE
jgi:hypothetical protein